jgi:hypothetical protein
MLILPPLTSGPRDNRSLNIIRLPSDLSSLNNYTGSILYQHNFNPDNGVVSSSKLQEYDVMRYTTDKTNVLNSFKAVLLVISSGTINVDAILDSGKGLYGQQTFESGVNPIVYTRLYDLRDSDNPKLEIFVYSPNLLGGPIETMPSNDWLKDSDLSQTAQDAINAFLQDPTQITGLLVPGVFPLPVSGTAFNNPKIVSGVIGSVLAANPTAQQEWTDYIASLGENPVIEYSNSYSSLQDMRTAFQARPEAENTIDPIFDITS